jgi:hypothetical protein
LAGATQTKKSRKMEAEPVNYDLEDDEPGVMMYVAIVVAVITV